MRMDPGLAADKLVRTIHIDTASGLEGSCMDSKIRSFCRWDEVVVVKIIKGARRARGRRLGRFASSAGHY